MVRIRLASGSKEEPGLGAGYVGLLSADIPVLYCGCLRPRTLTLKNPMGIRAVLTTPTAQVCKGQDYGLASLPAGNDPSSYGPQSLSHPPL